MSKANVSETQWRTIILPFVIVTAIWGGTWLVIRGQFGAVAPQWSVTYRFAIAALAMAGVALVQRHSLRPSRGLIGCATVLGFAQFCINFNAVYLAERFITSGLVATVFAILLVPNSLLAWAALGQRPSRQFALAALVAVTGIALLFVNEIRAHPARANDVASGIGLTLVGLAGASVANVYQATAGPRRYPITVLLAWAMALGAMFDAAIAWTLAGPPTIDPRGAYWVGLLYLSLAASVLCFSLYFPFIRRVGAGRAAYSSVLVPIIAMSLSTAFEAYRWTPLAAAGVALALGGMLLALARRPRPLAAAAPDAG